MNARHIFGGALIAISVVWLIAFPKHGNPTQPDYVASLAIGVGILVPGIVILVARRPLRMNCALGVLLAWSILVNAWLFSEVQDCRNLLETQQRLEAQHHR